MRYFVAVPLFLLGNLAWLPAKAAEPAGGSAPSASAGAVMPDPNPRSVTANDPQQADEAASVSAAQTDSNVAAAAQQPPPSDPSTPTLNGPAPAASGLQDVCSLDPSACPTVDNRITLQGPISAAPAVGRRHGDIGSKVDERFVMPSGYSEIRGEIAFITGEAVVTPKRLKMGDLALFRPSARRAFGEKVELSLGTTLLAKEPSSNRDWIWQGASLGATLEPWPGYAMMLEARGGPMLDGVGSVWSGGAGIAAKWALDRYARVMLSLGDLFTGLDERGHLAAQTWLNEVVFGGEAQFGRREAAAWVGVNYAVPVAKAGNVPNVSLPVALDPAVRLDLQVGGLLRVGEDDDWDLFAYYAWIDRGERERPESRLPLLDGGFDQQQVVLGVSHRFDPKHRLRER